MNRSRRYTVEVIETETNVQYTRRFLTKWRAEEFVKIVENKTGGFATIKTN